jgi:hypothetical protein
MVSAQTYQNELTIAAMADRRETDHGLGETPHNPRLRDQVLSFAFEV